MKHHIYIHINIVIFTRGEDRGGCCTGGGVITTARVCWPQALLFLRCFSGKKTSNIWGFRVVVVNGIHDHINVLFDVAFITWWEIV